MTLVNVKPRLWTKEAYHRLVDAGFLGPESRVELIEGAIVDLAAHKTPHAEAVMKGTPVLVEAYGKSHHVRVQLPLDAGELSEPEPDFLVVLKAGYIMGQHPAHADLVIEVADTSLDYDRDEKASLYARAGLPEYWIVNLVHDQLEVLRDPGPMLGTAFGHGYRSRTILPKTGTVVSLFAPTVTLRVADLF